MGNRHDLPKIKPEGQPSIMNAEAGKWGYLTLLGANLVALPFGLAKAFKASFSEQPIETLEKEMGSLKTASIIVLAVTAIGTVLGGLSGKKKQEQEQLTGQVVKDPGYWNKGIVGGLLASALVQGTIGMFRSTKSMMEKPTGAFFGIVVPVGAAVAGSIIRKNSLQRDYDKSIAVQQGNHTMTQGLLQQVVNGMPVQAPVQQVPVMEPIYKNSVTADEAALLAAKQEQAPAPIAHVEKTPTPATSHEATVAAQAEKATSEPLARSA